MITDSYFEVASGKPLCQDYALSGKYRDLTYAVGCDGCSGSKDSDVGARLLAHTAREKLLYMHAHGYLDSDRAPINLSEMLKELILNRCRDLRAQLCLDYNVFDATLWIIAGIREEYAMVFGWGDGTVIIRRIFSDERRLIKREYVNPVPYYLSHSLSITRDKAYKEENSSKTVIETQESLSDSGNNYRREYHYDTPFCERFRTDVLRSISICSDGINSYKAAKSDFHTYEMLSPHYIAQEFMTYKNCVGEFVKRRMMAVKKKFEKADIIHYDDILCATVLFEGLSHDGDQKLSEKRSG